MAKNEITAEQMARLQARNTKKLARTWLAEILRVTRGLTIAKITDMMAEGKIEEAIKAITVSQAKWYARYWLTSYTESAELTAAFIETSLGVPIVFDVQSLAPEAALRAHRLRLVRGFTVEQTQASMQAISRGFEEGLNPRGMARAFRDSIGLTQRQEQAVANYRTALEEGSSSSLDRKLRDARFDRTVRRSIEDGRPLTRPQVDRMVGRYRQRTLKYRSEVIGRTESLRATNGGQRDMLRAAVDEGDLRQDQLKREWNTAIDERVRDSHSPMSGQEVTGTEIPFISGLGNELLYPGDPGAPAEDTVQCRCAVGTRIVKIIVPA